MNETEIHSSWRHETSSRVRDGSLVELQAIVGRIEAGGGNPLFYFKIPYPV